jgi:hypothetical protein
VLWRESADNGASWKARVVIGSHLAGGSRVYNSSPSTVWPTASKRLVLFNAGGGALYRDLIRVGSS